MKKLYFLFILLVTIFSSSLVKANEITVKGHLKFANGDAAKNVVVNFSVLFSTNTSPCTASTTTDNDGAYTKQVSCTGGDIKKVTVTVKNCDGQLLSETKEVPSTKIVEQNFTLCSPPPPPPATCNAKFEFTFLNGATSTPGFAYKFNSIGSTTGSGDKIVSRTWKFGDGEELAGNTIDPTHIYKTIGNYNVCLTIKSDKGCSNTSCATIEVKSACQAHFTFEQTTAGTKFNSNTSITLPNDPIVKRTWNFGDGTDEVKDLIDPTHKFAKAGTYTVCLTTKTAGGCESKECKQVVVQTPTTTACAAKFSYNTLGPKKFSFNSSASIVSTGDNIVSRLWDFHDGTQSTDGAPTHEFSKPGTYEVCLKITTAKGCESRSCMNVKVEEINNDNTPIRIVSLYPTPVHGELNTVVYSRNNNVVASLSIVDVYGEVKWTSSSKTLVQGDNPFTIPAANLIAGPYFFKVTTQYGTLSKSFYKL